MIRTIKVLKPFFEGFPLICREFAETIKEIKIDRRVSQFALKIKNRQQAFVF